MCFFFNDTATTEIYTLSLHDALPILLVLFQRVVTEDGLVRHEQADAAADPSGARRRAPLTAVLSPPAVLCTYLGNGDRKSTRLNSSHANIPYAVFCLKKKKNIYLHIP